MWNRCGCPDNCKCFRTKPTLCFAILAIAYKKMS